MMNEELPTRKALRGASKSGLIEVCSKHRIVPSKDCAVCKFMVARSDMVMSFWYISMCAKGPKPGGSTMHGSDVAQETSPPRIRTKEEEMKLTLEHILEVSTTLANRHATPAMKRFMDMWNKKK